MLVDKNFLISPITIPSGESLIQQAINDGYITEEDIDDLLGKNTKESLLSDYCERDAFETLNLFDRVIDTLLLYTDEDTDETDEQECDGLGNDFQTPAAELGCAGHAHVRVFAPTLSKILILPDFIPGVWHYVVDGKIHQMQCTIDQVPVFGLFTPYDLEHVLQKLPKED